VVSTNTSLVDKKVDTPLKSLVGAMIPLQDLTTGSVPTHGTLTGVKTVSSELNKETVALMMLPSVVLPLLTRVTMNSCNDSPYF